jgi:FixJ family two-component response regulator
MIGVTDTMDRDGAPVVLILDDDVDIRTAIAELMLAAGIEARSYGTIHELLKSPLFERANCLVLDVQMPEMTGLEVQERLIAAGYSKSIVFLTGHGDIEMSVRAMKAGAVDFLTKPVAGSTLLAAVMTGVRSDIAKRAEERAERRNVERYAALTPRESQVLRAVADGRLNKQIAHELGIAEVTVKLHRGNVMKKMGAASIAELIRAWENLPLALREARNDRPHERLHAVGDCATMLEYGGSI